MIILSNREPYEHVANPNVSGGIETRFPLGGLVSALDPLMRRTHGVWIAWGSGSADHETVDAHDRLPVPPPPEPSEYTLRRIWLTDEDVEGYYLGFANTSLWPLCHMLIPHFQFRDDHWSRYESVNAAFADAAVDEMAQQQSATGERPVVWLQDYHFACVAENIRAQVPDALIHHFWHIPFPPPEIFHLLPYGVRRAVLRGLLGNDLIEFQTDRYVHNFLTCVAELLPEASVDHEQRRASYGDHETEVAAFPISIDVDHFEALASSPGATEYARALRARYAPNGRQLGVSVDRIDYTKGIPERLRALELLWTESPEYREQLTMLIVAAQSRSDIAAYRALDAEITQLIASINERFATSDWTPIVLMNATPAHELAGIYRAADLCLISSLQDGMNLVAKEFVACQVDECGVLMLSRFTGAASETEGAVLVNPFATDSFAAGIRSVLAMSPAERQQRMHALRTQLRGATADDWLQAIDARLMAIPRVL